MIKPKWLYFAVVLTLALQITPAEAVWFSKDEAGTTGAQFLKLGCGSRAIAMGEAYSALAHDASAIYWNPAGLSRMQDMQFQAMHSFALETINFDFLGFAQPMGIGTMGIGLNLLTMSPLDKLNEFGEKTGSFAPYDAAINLAFAMPIFSIPLGINLKYLRQDIDSNQAQGFAFDLGGLYPIFSDRLQAGLAIQNLGPAIKFIEKTAPLPLLIRLGVSSENLIDHLTLALDGNFPIDNNPHIHFGCEYVIDTIENVPIACRAGYKTDTTADIDALAGLSLGFGVRYKKFCLDYAWVPYGGLGSIHSLALSYTLDSNTTEVVADKRKTPSVLEKKGHHKILPKKH